MAHFEITCANCGHPEFRMTAPTALSAAELLELAQQKLREEAEQNAAAGVRYNPPAPLPDAPSMQEASGVREVVETVEQADRLQGTGWDVAKWATPNKWIAWESKVPSAKCESCGGPIELGEQCRWLMQSRAPGGTGLTMHVDCWLSEQEHS